MNNPCENPDHFFCDSCGWCVTCGECDCPKDSPNLIKTQEKSEAYKKGKEAIKRLRSRN